MAATPPPTDAVKTATSSTGIPPPQSFVVPSFSTGAPGSLAMARLYRRRNKPLNRGAASHVIDAELTRPLSTPTPMSGLHAMLTPTPATHAGSTVLTHVGSAASGGPRIVIPLPAVLATATALSSKRPDATTAISSTPSSQQSPPSMLVDNEWFMLQSYPRDIQEFIATSFTLGLPSPMPRGGIIEATQQFLRQAYVMLEDIQVRIPIPSGLKSLFDRLVLTKSNQPVHPYGENEDVNNAYYVLAYVLSTQLWNRDEYGAKFHNYNEVTYPGVIVVTYLSRLTQWYKDLSQVLGIGGATGINYLRDGGRIEKTDDANIVSRPDRPKRNFLDSLPGMTNQLRIAASIATNRLTIQLDSLCSLEEFYALRDAVLNIPNLNREIVNEIVKNYNKTKFNSRDPRDSKIFTTRCLYLQGLLRRTISPDDVQAASKALEGDD